MNILRRMVGLFLLLVAIVCFGYPHYMDWKMGQKAENMTQQVQEQVQQEVIPEANTSDESMENESNTDKTTFPLYRDLSVYNQRLQTDGQKLVDAWSYQQDVVSFEMLPNGEFGSIEIPDMNVSMPLYLGASEDHLANGAAVLSETSIPIGGNSTNSVISGHRGWYGHRYFQDIHQLTVGSLVYIHNPWETLTYQAVGIDIIDPYNIDAVKIQPNKDMITLLTCHPIRTWVGGGTYRYLVYCERVTNDTKPQITTEPLPQLHPNPEIDEAVQEEVEQTEDFIKMEPFLQWLLPFILCPLGFLLLLLPNQKQKR